MTKTHKHHPKPAPRSIPFFGSLSPTMQDVVCVALLYLVILFLFRAIVFDRMAFQVGGDTANAHSYLVAGTALQKAEGEDALWMPPFFSGMPTFGNVAFVPHDVNFLQTALQQVLDLLFLKGPWTWLVVHYFLGGVFMFLLMRVLGFEHLLALFGAVTFMISPYAVQLAGEGHGSKLMALNYLPAAFLLTHLVFERRDALSFGLLGAAIGTLMLTNHMQIVYYVLLVLGVYMLFRVAAALRSAPGRTVAGGLLFAGALLLGFAIASYIYLSVYDYAQYSIRGGGAAGVSGGLSYDYATGWSWHPAELLTLFIPAFFGMKVEYYWGFMQPWTNSSVYVGLLPMVFAIVAVALRRNLMTIFLAVTTVVVVLVSFGRTVPIVYDVFFAVLPFFNKFRAPAMILHLLPFLLGILGTTGLAVLVERQEELSSERGLRVRKAVQNAALAFGALAVLTLLFRSPLFESLSGSLFTRAGETEELRRQYGARATQAMTQLVQTRYDVFWKDTVKFFILAAASLGAVVAFLRGSVRKHIFLVLILSILVIDLGAVAGKYIDPKPSTDLERGFAADATVQYLKLQPGKFRVFPVGQLFMDNSFAYHGLESIGGYSPAKLKIYQTLLDSTLYAGPDPQFPINMNIVNMLNAEYVVALGRLPEDRFQVASIDQGRRAITYRNPGALPRAWYAGDVRSAATDGETFRLLNSENFNPARIAVIDHPLGVEIAQPDSGIAPRITDYRSRRITLESSTPVQTLLVLSEVYYPAGWKAFVDGNETEIHRTNYALRSVVVPAGKHEVVFRFDPPLYTLGYRLSIGGWVIALVCIAFGLWRSPFVRQRLARTA